MELCPCGTKKSYEKCCGRFHSGKELPETALELMRSRYSAFVKGEVDYIFSTHYPDKRSEVNPEEIQEWSKKSTWHGLEVKGTRQGLKEDKTGQVEFIACYETEGNRYDHHEVADFKKEDDKWYFVDGHIVGQTFRRDGPKIGRNDPCPCGSNKKFKKCCGK